MLGSVLLPVLASVATTRLGTVATLPLRPAALRRLERLGVALLAGLAIVALVSLALAVAGVWNAWLLGGILLAAWAALEVLARRRPPEPAAIAGLWGDLVVVGAVVVLFVLALPAFPALVGGRDYGTYTATGEVIRDHGSLHFLWPPLESVPPSARAAVTANDIAPGFYLDDPASNWATPQGFHLMPALLAPAGAVSGDAGLWMIVVISALGLLAAALLAMRLARERRSFAGAVVALLLLTDVAWFWYARMPMTETLNTTLVLGGVWLWVVAHDEESTGAAVLGGLLAGASLFTRPDAFLIAAGAVVVIVWLIVVGRTNRRVWSFAGAFAGMMLLAIGYTALRGRRYVGDIVAAAFHTDRSLLFWLAGVLALGVIAIGAGLAIRALAGRAIERNAVVLGRVVAVAVAVAVIGYAVVAYQQDFLGVRWLRMYLSSAAVVAAGAGMIVLVAQGLRYDRLLRVAPLVVLTAMLTAYFGRSPLIFPDQFWGIRRFIAVPIPAFAILTGCLLSAALAMRGRLRVPAVGALAVVLAISVVHQVDDLRPVYRHVEFSGSATGLERADALLRGADTILAGPGEIVRNRVGIGLVIWHSEPLLGIVGRLDTGPPADWLADIAGRSDVRLLVGDEVLPALDLTRVRVEPVGSSRFAITEFDQPDNAMPHRSHLVPALLGVFRVLPAAESAASAPDTLLLAEAAPELVTGFGRIKGSTRSTGLSGAVLVGPGTGTTLRIKMGAPDEPGATVVVRADGIEVGRLVLDAAVTERTFTLPAAPSAPVSVAFEVVRPPLTVGPGVAVERVSIGA